LGGKSFGDKRLTYTPEHYQSAIRLVEWYKKIFGDRYYIETQRFPGLERTCALNAAYERISHDTGVALAATSDCHYVFARDNEMQKILHAAHRSASVSQVEASWEYDVTLNIPESDTRVWDDLRATGLTEQGAEDALFNTSIIADRCNVMLPKVEPIRYKIDESDYAPWV
jgi:DNA polymerase-3 subunit alpha